MIRQLSRLVGKNLSMGIDAETASVGELTPSQLSIAATTAFNRGIEVWGTDASLSQHCLQAYRWPCSGFTSLRGYLQPYIRGATGAFSSSLTLLVVGSQLTVGSASEYPLQFRRVSGRTRALSGASTFTWPCNTWPEHATAHIKPWSMLLPDRRVSDCSFSDHLYHQMCAQGRPCSRR